MELRSIGPESRFDLVKVGYKYCAAFENLTQANRVLAYTVKTLVETTTLEHLHLIVIACNIYFMIVAASAKAC